MEEDEIEQLARRADIEGIKELLERHPISLIPQHREC